MQTVKIKNKKINLSGKGRLFLNAYKIFRFVLGAGGVAMLLKTAVGYFICNMNFGPYTQDPSTSSMCIEVSKISINALFTFLQTNSWAFPSLVGGSIAFWASTHGQSIKARGLRGTILSVLRFDE